MPGREKTETPKAGRAAKDAKAPVPAGKKRQAQKPTSAYESLTPRDQKFVDLFVATSQKANSAIEAGYSPRSAHAIISKKLKTDQFSQAIAERRAALHTRLNVTQADMARPLLTIADTGMSKFVHINSDGEPYIDLSKCTPEQLDCLSEVQIDEFVDGRGKGARNVRRVRIKLIPRLDAIEKLNRMFGFYADDAASARKDDALADLLTQICRRGSKPPIRTISGDVIEGEAKPK